jgi:UDP-glucuronate 4-epimerase
MNILVTGCAGFIGSHVTEQLLHQGHSVIGIDNFDDFYAKSIKENNLSGFLNHPNFRFKDLDLRNVDELESIEESFDVVVHLAAKAGVLPSLKNPQAYISSNILATNNLLELMRQRNCKKLVFASSSSVYGNNRKTPFEESDDVNNPISIYAQTKKSCELLNYTYHHLYHFDIINLRFFTVFGPRQRPDLAIHKFFAKINAGEPIEMYGDGHTARDYTYIDDTVSGVISAINYVTQKDTVYEIINLGNKTPIQLNDLIATIYETMNQEPNIIKQPMQPGDVDITFASIEKANRLLNYHPTTSLKNGLLKFKEWYVNKK